VVGGTPLKILVVDDTPTNVKQVEAVARRLGHQVVTAEDGLQAVARFEETAPDLIIMDIMMPRMDGIEAARRIRERESAKWVPIVFFSALDRSEDILRGLEQGGDDYLVKPASLQMLQAKINSYARMLHLQQVVLQNNDELTAWRSEAEEQNRLGGYVMQRLTEGAGLRDPCLQHMNMPADTFSGDLLCAARSPAGVLYVMLADAAGHGLAAALTAMPLTQAFNSMTGKGFPIGSIAQEMNRKLKALLPADRFVALSLAAIDVRSQTVEVWNGGNPDVLFVTHGGQVTMRWVSRHPPLGILPDELFSADTETFVYHEAGQMLLCSDGLIEAESPDGKRLGINAVGEILSLTSPERRYEALLHGLKTHSQGHPRHDDVSCMLVDVPVERRGRVRVDEGVAGQTGPVSGWRMSLSLGPQELRGVDVVPAALGMMTHVQALKTHQGALFLILSELYNNALDHGLLRLNSVTKSTPGGFELYLQQRGERLAKLDNGRIDLLFDLRQLGDEAVLDVEVSDSGPGFDYQSFLAAESAEDELSRPHGRGIGLVRSLCRELVYSGNGNQVRARFVL
jgi:CheY-like chemotaxis protein